MNKDTFEFFRGAITGISQVIVGHPFDTYKAWKQTNSPLLKNIQYRKLYNGVFPPLLANGFLNSIFFGLTNNFYNQTGNWYISGAGAGLIGAVIANPFDVWKINKQTETKIPRHNSLFVSSMKIAMRGIIYSMARESTAMAAYFGIYHHIDDNYSVHPALNGAFTGIASWVITYPIDVIKTRIQADYSMTLGEALSLKNYWRGLNFVVLRAGIVNGLSFWVYSNLTYNSFYYDNF